MWEGLKVKDTGRLTLAFRRICEFVSYLSLLFSFEIKILRIFFRFLFDCTDNFAGAKKYDGGLQSFALEMIARRWGWWRARPSSG